jgi:ADP-glucose pyrophosphorylase
MTETVLNLAKQSLGNRFLMIMPDTVFEFHKGYIFDDSKSDLTLSLWRIRSDQYGKLGQVSVDMNGKVLDCVDKNPDCRYEFSWGAMSFNQKFLEILNNEFPHVGYGILPAIQSNLEVNSVVFPGRYWDCGTPLEYLRYLKTLEI